MHYSGSYILAATNSTIVIQIFSMIMMAEACEDMVTVVIYEKTTYNLVYIPSQNSLIVEEKTKYLENYLCLEQFGKEDILRLGQLIHLAYFGVAGQADLQIKVRPGLSTVSDLCDDVIHMLNGCKRSFHGAVIKIQTAYEYLDKSAESNALQMLKSMEPISQNLSTASKSLSQKCSEQAEYLLQVHHVVEKEKETVEDEVRKQKMQLSDNKKEKHKCEIQIKRSTKAISQHDKKIASYKKSISSTLEKKAKCIKQYEKDITNANNKCEKQLSILKRKFESSCVKASEDSNHAKPSAHNKDKKVDHKLMEIESSCQDHLVKEHQGHSCDMQISVGQKSMHCSENKESKLKIPCDADTVEISRAQNTMRQFFNTNDNSEFETISEANEDLKDTPNLASHSEVIKTKIIGTPHSQAQKDNKSIKAEEASLQEYMSKKHQIELQTKVAKEDIQNKHQIRIKKLDEQLESLDQQLTTSNTEIKENEQKIKDNQEKFTKLFESIAEMTKTIELNDASIECISYTITALYTIGSIMKKLGNFLKEFASLCCQLNECILFKQINYLQNKKELWKSNTFKREMLYCYRDYIAFINISTTAIKYITQAQEEVYHNVSKDLSRDEVLKLVQNHPNIIHKYMIEL